jgi:hypothetical protein
MSVKVRPAPRRSAVKPISPAMLQFIAIGIIGILAFGIVAAVQAGNSLVTVVGDLVKWVIVPALVLIGLFWKREELRLIVENRVHSRALAEATARATRYESLFTSVTALIVEEYSILFGEPDTDLSPRSMIIGMRAEIMGTRSERDTARRTLRAYEDPRTGYIAKAAHWQELAGERRAQLTIAEEVGQRFARERDEAQKAARLATERADMAEAERDTTRQDFAEVVGEYEALRKENQNLSDTITGQDGVIEGLKADVATLTDQLQDRPALSWDTLLAFLVAAQGLPTVNMNNLASLARSHGLEVGKGILQDGTWKAFTHFARNALAPSPAENPLSNKLLLRVMGEGSAVNAGLNGLVNGESNLVHAPVHSENETVNAVVNSVSDVFADLHEGVNTEGGSDAMPEV